MSHPKPHYVVLHGAKKNVGDFLIRQRALSLLQTFRPDRDLIELEGWKPLDSHLDHINSANALIIMGGPGIQHRTYPNVYPLAKQLEDIKTQICLLGSGCFVKPGSLKSIAEQRMSTETLSLLSRSKISVRDEFTKLLLSNYGIDKAQLTGCPAWYYLPEIDKPFPSDQSIERIVLSTPQKKIFFPQFEALIKAVQASYPAAQLRITFNRGYKRDEFTSKKVSEYMSHYWQKFSSQGLECADLSYDLPQFEQHIDADLHLGYRLHTHIYFLSRRKPSYLIAEDSRGVGHNYTLDLGELNGIKNMDHVTRIQSVLPGHKLRVNMQKLLETRFLDHQLPQRVMSMIQNDTQSGFERLKNSHKKMRFYFENMKEYLRNLP